MDRSLGRSKLPAILRAAGLVAHVHDDLFPQNTPDEGWLAHAGSKRWIVLTRDARIRYNVLEREALLAAAVHTVVLTSADLTSEEAGALIVSAARRVERLSQRHRHVAFIAALTRGPQIRVILSRRR